MKRNPTKFASLLTFIFISAFSFAQIQIDSVIVVNETCAGSCDGSLTIYTSGGTNPILYDIGGTASPSNIFTGLCAANYLVTVNDGAASSDTITTTVTGIPITYTVSTTNCSAYGVCDGTANTIIAGGTPPYTITYYEADATTIIQTGSTTNISNLCADTFHVSVTDVNGCISTGPIGPSLNMFIITQPPPPTLNANMYIWPSHCYPNCTGTAEIIASGGVPPYTYSWGSWIIGPFCDFDPIPAWTVTDFIGQQVSGPSGYMQVNIPTISSIITSDETCPGLCDGEVEVIIQGGFPPFTYSIDSVFGVQSSPIFNNLCPGTDIIRVMDSYGCGDYQPYTINAATPLIVTIDSITNISCTGECTGDATLNVSGGQPPYTYVWNTIPICTTPNLGGCAGVCAGTYSCTVTDDNNCSTIISGILITEPSGTPLGATWNSTPETCNGLCDGSAMVIASGGAQSYTYLWDDLCASTTDSTGCAGCQGSYQCIVTDTNGCNITVTNITVGGPTALSISFNTINPSCFGLCDGNTTATISGGTPPYTYSWSTSLTDTNATVNDLCDGTYYLTVTDSVGCTLNDSIVVNEPTPLVLNATSISSTCNSSNGSATVNVGGGTPNYTYSWNTIPVQTTATASNINANSYTVVVTDSNGCTGSTIATVIDLSGPVIDSITTTDITCFGFSDGTATVYASGNSAFTYSWNDPMTQFSQTATNLNGSPGLYVVTITDSNGCIVSGQTQINEPSPIQAIINAPDTICFGNVVQLFANASGGTTPYVAFNWSGGINQSGQGPILDTLTSTTTYNLFVIDNNGCVSSITSHVVNVDLCTGIAENTNGFINKIYPNPTEGIINIDFANKTVFPIIINVIDMNGQLVQQKTFNNNGTVIDLSQLPKGIYLLNNTNLSIRQTIILE
ncbi:MAG: hypothetical protein COB15_03780 [Flavobacteriales bacterium]|nr:MAG: hypothetical protein COB15_03780 [Flavobacteriales bacterium]